MGQNANRSSDYAAKVRRNPAVIGNASQITQTTEMGVRSEGREVGAQAPLQQDQAVAQEETLDQVLLAAARRRRSFTNGVTTINRHWHITKKKWCFGPLHPPGGALLPCDPDDECAFYMNRRGKKAGRPYTYCKQCEHLRRGRDPANSGFVSVAEGREMAYYLAKRIGKTEFRRRAELSVSFFARLDLYPTMRMATLNRIRRVYHEVRADREQRSVNDIKYGAYLRGKEESRRLARAEIDKGGWRIYLEFMAERNAAKPTTPDSQFWHFTGMEWLPRYGEEMLGKDF